MSDADRLWENLRQSMADSIASQQAMLAIACGVDELTKEIRRLRQWVSDLQSGAYITCAYCGHRYGPKEGGDPSMVGLYREHVEKCADHPCNVLVREIEAMKVQRSELLNRLNELQTAAESA